MNEPQGYANSPSKYDRAMGALAGLPDVTHTPPSTVRGFTPMVGAVQSFIIQTYRQIERDGDKSRGIDTCFIEYLDDERSVRLVLPHKVLDKIQRQRESLTHKVRKRAATEQANVRKAMGVQPGFMKGKKGGKTNEKREATLKRGLLDFIEQNPGKQSYSIPVKYRRVLRRYEKQGLIEWRKVDEVVGWFLKGDQL
jgi:hypothetical protein